MTLHSIAYSFLSTSHSVTPLVEMAEASILFFLYKPKIRKVILFNTNTMQIFLNSTNIDKGNNYPTPKFQKTLFSIPFYH